MHRSKIETDSLDQEKPNMTIRKVDRTEMSTNLRSRRSDSIDDPISVNDLIVIEGRLNREKCNALQVL